MNENTAMLIESDDEEKINRSITKNSLKALSSKNKTQKGKNNNNQFVELFSGMKFVFIPCGMHLTAKRISIFSENIRKRGGNALQYDDFFFDWKQEEKTNIFVLTSKEITQPVLSNVFSSTNLPKNQPLVDCEWITACIQKNQLLDYNPFLINGSEKQPKLETTGTAITKLAAKIENHQSPVNDQQSNFREELMKIKQVSKLKAQTQPTTAPTIKYFNYREALKSYQYLYDYMYDKPNPTSEIQQEEETNTMTTKLPPPEFFQICSSESCSSDHSEEEEKLPEVKQEEEKLTKKSSSQENNIIVLDDDDSFDDHKEEIVEKNKIKIEPEKSEFFVCEVGMKQNYNEHVTNILEKVFKAYEVIKDEKEMKGYPYGKVISLVKTFPRKITSKKDIKEIPNIGPAMIQQLEEIVSTGGLRKAQYLYNDEMVKVLMLFNSIWGVGQKAADKFYKKGLRTIEDLKKNQDLLTYWQKIGLKYYKDFQKDVSREFVHEVYEKVKTKLFEISNSTHDYEVICAGSYRRGKMLCSDINIIISPRDEKAVSGLISKLVKSLEGSLLTDHLNLPKEDANGVEMYMGVCCHKDIHRRIDINAVPRACLGPAIVLFTGSEYYTRSLKLYARKNEFAFENFGLYKTNSQDKYRKNLMFVPCTSEEEVFNKIKLKYIPPNERDI